jgi:hypothetical protein
MWEGSDYILEPEELDTINFIQMIQAGPGGIISGGL